MIGKGAGLHSRTSHSRRRSQKRGDALDRTLFMIDQPEAPVR